MPAQPMFPRELFTVPFSVGYSLSCYKYPAFYDTAYDIRRANAGGVACLAIGLRETVRLPLLKRTIERLEGDFGLPCLVVAPRLSAYQRRRLSEEGVAWYVSADNLHVPFVGLAICKAKAKGRRPASLGFSPMAQLIALRVVDGTWCGLSTTQVAQLTGKSLSSTCSYFREISDALPQLVGSSGRTRFLAVDPKPAGRDLFDALRPRLSNPVKRVVFLKCAGGAADLERAGLLYAGATAYGRFARASAEHGLASSAMPFVPDGEHGLPTFAIGPRGEKALADAGVPFAAVSAVDDPDVELEVWSYEPGQGECGCVDEASLALSLGVWSEQELLDALFALRRASARLAPPA